MPRRASCAAGCSCASRLRGVAQTGTFHVPLRDRGNPLPRPCGLFPRRLRCSAPRTAPGSTNPCIPALPRRMMFRATLGFCGRMPPKPGPPEARRGCEGSVRRRAHTMCARSLNVHGRTSSEPRSTLADLQGRMPGRRAAGGVFLWLPFFAQAKKVTRSPAGRVEALLSLNKKREASKTDSRLRGMTREKKECSRVIGAICARSPAARSGRRRCR